MHTDVLPGPWVQPHLVGFDLRRRPHLEADVLVIGGGVAGLSAALAAADAGAEVLLLVKSDLWHSNTVHAQGGVAAVLGNEEREALDDVELHVSDTLQAGVGLCDENVVRSILTDALPAINFLRQHGCIFDLGGDGTLALAREGGHSARRILHSNGDSTGAEVGRSLAQAVMKHDKITVVDHAFAIDLLRDGERVVGALYYRREELIAAMAGTTILATGGCGWVWRETTNPSVATGDGLAMAYRAGAVVADLEFMQFHPTTLYIAGGARLLITEAMRGEGAYLKNSAGERFMTAIHPNGELAPRDVVTRGIVNEIRRTGFPHMWLDATHLGNDFLRSRFPTIYDACNSFGIDITKEWIPVHPSAHYHCGGVLSDGQGQSTLPGLLVAGEVACSGLHGANRLASNSLLEGLVMGIRAGKNAALSGGPVGRRRITVAKSAPAPTELDVPDLVRSVRSLMWRQVGIERCANELATARRSLQFWMRHQANGEFRTREGWELQNLLTVGSLITTASERRTASVGTHLRSDSVGDVLKTHLGLKYPGEK